MFLVQNLQEDSAADFLTDLKSVDSLGAVH